MINTDKEIGFYEDVFGNEDTILANGGRMPEYPIINNYTVGINGGRIVWSNENLDLEDWRADLEEEYPGYSDDELFEIMCETNRSYLSDERVKLNIQLSQPILVVADLGLRNGRRMGYREIESGNIRDCLYSNYDYTTWYVDKNGDFRCVDIHHAGTNHYLYRVYKDNASEAQKDELKEKLYDGTATRADIVRITRRLGDDIGKVYGWTFPKVVERSHDYEQ